MRQRLMRLAKAKQLHGDANERRKATQAQRDAREAKKKFDKFAEAQRAEYDSWRHTSNREKEARSKELSRPTNFSIFSKETEDLSNFLS